MRHPVEPVVPQPGQESVWGYPRPPRVEPSQERIRVVLGGELILDVTESVRVLETSHPPVYYFPREAFRPATLELASGTSYCEFKGTAQYLNIRGGGLLAAAAGWFYPQPAPPYITLTGHVALYPGKMDYCEVDGECVRPQAGAFYGGWITSRVVGPFKGEPGTMFW
ncbi:DUF427 domain-containing protein [Arthrobacter sp. W4I7]|uniref:DUF427 domain-containing protein n=1 Tax=Arthrobacter sp. W4I7 TaxID=3042296 RepID=UPI00278B2DEE|nr:DUF427 domain-containing protein [Arthrobacter sp. W4I7]MDQ0692363.1 uncharacterized protein (DUF427 family) [Arthrobacter sp. W4I7]